MSVWVAEDRSMSVRQDQVVKTAWVDIDACRLGSRVPMASATLDEKARKLICIGDGIASWPPIVGHWADDRFVVCDGRHEYLASQMLGRAKLFVAWLETIPKADADAA